MSNYTKNTNFTAKDNLTSGDPAKVIKGAEFDTEFNSLQTAVNSKADSNNSQLTGITDAQAVETTGDVTVGGNLSVTGNATIAGNLTFGDADTDTVSFSADVNSNILPNLDATYDLGSATKEWRDLYVDGTAYVDTVNLNGSNITATATELNYTDGVTSNIQTQLNSKAATTTSPTITLAGDLSGNATLTNLGNATLTATVADDSHNHVISNVDGLQTALDSKANLSGANFTGSVDVTGTITADGLTVDGNNNSLGAVATLSNTNTSTDGNTVIGNLIFESNDDSAPATNAEIKGISAGTGGQTELYIRTGVNGVPNNRVKFGFGGDVSFYEDTGTTAKMVWDASAESLGIGTASPSDKLHIEGTQMRITDSSGINSVISSIYSGISLRGNGAGTRGIKTTSNDALTFGTGDSERARIDSSGNLLVGTTNSVAGVGNTDAGVSMRGTQGSFFSRDSGVAIHAGRSGNDGEIIQLRKDGTTVGSIGTRYDDIYIGNSGTGITMDATSSRVKPCSPASSGVLRDNAIDLGDPSARFKDLYLSGGVYLGGTGAANKLDDYEEGTWTPTIIGSTGGTANVNAVTTSYTKIGNTVRVDCYLNLSDVTGLSGAVRLSGLPFTGSGYSPITVAYCSLFDFDERTDTVGGFTESGSAFVNLTFGSASSTIPSTNATATSGTIMFHATYKTTQ